MSILDKITEKKLARLNIAKSGTQLSVLKQRLSECEPTRDFKAAITRGQRTIRLIAEIKKASPSRGLIKENFAPGSIAEIYEEKSVDAVSVLTEEDFFQGDINYIAAVKSGTSRPVLRKDFIIDEYQIYEARAFGADAILLIASLLERQQAEEYLHLCRELGLSVLFEVHDHAELEKTLRVDAGIIGINNRNLKTMSVDLKTTFLLKKEISSDKVVVSESGIKTRDDVLSLEAAGIDAMLIGTSLMEAKDLGQKIDELRGA